MPRAIITSVDATNRYVGMAKMLPDARIPRRLPIMIKPMTAMPIPTRTSKRAGTAEATCSIADDVETATVIT